MTDPSQYFKGRTVQEQMNEVIGYVDVRSAEVATDAIAADVAQVHSDAADAHADALAAAASAAAAAGTLANAVKKTGEVSQSIDGDIDLNDDLNVDGDVTIGGALGVTGAVTVPTPVNNTDAANKKYVDDADALKLNISDVNTYAVGLTGNQDYTGIKNNLTEGQLYIVVGGSTERWVRLAYGTVQDAAGEITVLPDKQTGVTDSMKAWFLIRQNLCIFRYMNTLGTLDPTRYALTFDGTTYELWYHYTTNDTNHRITALIMIMNGGRVMTVDGVTAVASLNPADYTVYQNPVIL